VHASEAMSYDTCCHKRDPVLVQSIDGSDRELADFAALALVSAQRAALEV
jgi:hypothetical protein